MNVNEALRAICSTGEGFCWYCDSKLPAADSAIREGWVDRASFEPMVLKAWQGLKQLYWRGGMAANCRGSAYGHEDAYYLERPQGWAKMPHMILAATEVQRLVSGKGKKAKSG